MFSRTPQSILETRLTLRPLDLRGIEKLLRETPGLASGLLPSGKIPLTALLGHHLVEDAATSPERFIQTFQALREAGATLDAKDKNGASALSCLLAVLPRNHIGHPRYDAMSQFGGTVISDTTLDWVLDSEPVTLVIDIWLMAQSLPWAREHDHRFRDGTMPGQNMPWTVEATPAALPPLEVWDVPMVRLHARPGRPLDEQLIPASEAMVMRAFLLARAGLWTRALALPGAAGFLDPQNRGLLEMAVAANSVDGVDACLSAGARPVLPLDTLADGLFSPETRPEIRARLERFVLGEDLPGGRPATSAHRL